MLHHRVSVTIEHELLTSTHSLKRYFFTFPAPMPFVGVICQFTVPTFRNQGLEGFIE